MSPMIFDLIIIGLFVLSVALGFARGFCKEVFTIFGWVAAIIATIYFTPVAREVGRHLIEKKWLADLATAAVIFLGTLLACSIVSYFATKTLHATKLGLADRILGFVFGIVRAVVILGLAYMLFLFTFANPENRPAFVTEARTKPFLEASANWLQTVLPVGDMLDEPAPKDKADKPGQTEDSKDVIVHSDPSDTLQQSTIPAEKSNNDQPQK